MKGTSLALLALGFAFACSTDEPTDALPPTEDTAGYDDDFARAAADHDVPVELLKAIAYVETGWNMVRGEEEHDGHEPASGIFALRGDNLALGAAAAGVSEDLARTDAAANIATAAARLSLLADEQGVARADLAAWTPVIAAWSGITDEDALQTYVHDVMTVLANGATAIAEDGTVIALVEPNGTVEVPAAPGTPRATVDFPGAIWRGSPNFSSRGSFGVSLVVIHTCEGGYAGCWATLRSASSGVSAHYVVKEDGSEVTQLVRESNKAWHISADYACSRNNNQQCNRNGVGTNSFSVGIEHAGFASSTFSTGMIEKSAKLTCDIAKSHNMPRDRNHIVGHGQLQPWNRTDPGPNWPWSHYVDRVRAACGDGGTTPPPGPGGVIVIDSNNANNNAAVARIELTGTWTSTTSTAGYYGSGYWTAPTSQTSAPATFWFYLPAAGTKTIDAWWTTGSNRSTAAPFIAFNAAGTEVGRKTVNQQTNGSRWVTLGTWNFSAGWNQVALSRWAASGKFVVADAVRVR